METIDWTQFTRRISIKRDCDTILKHWLTQENIEKWFLSKSEFSTKENELKNKQALIAKGDQYVWMWHGSENVVEGEILSFNGIDFLEFTFLGCHVSVKIFEENGENVVELTQSNIPTDDQSKMDYYIECTRGWTFYLSNLKSILEGGIDLRNKNIELKRVINT